MGAMAALLVLASLGPARADDFAPLERRLDLPGGGAVPLLVSPEWDGAPATRAVVVIHGLGGNAAGYYRALARAAHGAGAQATLLAAPHFLSPVGSPAPELLRWRRGAWSGGAPALGPTHVSSFAVLDTLLARLADRARYPDLREVVVIGHSAGAQFVQRYVAVGQGVPAGSPLPVRYVVANPSSFLWFGRERPEPAIAAACPGYDNWKYGLAGPLPPYVTDPPATLESRYLARSVTYLSGGADTDPAQRDLDRTCAGEAQGPDRLSRSRAFLAALAARHPTLPPPPHFLIPGVGHNGGRMIDSACGRAVLFGAGRCE